MEITKLSKEVLGSNGFDGFTSEYLIKVYDGSLSMTENEFAELVELVVAYKRKIDLAGLPADVIESIRASKKIDAIKQLRCARNMGLREAKDAVEKWAADNGVEWRSWPTDLPY